MIIKRRVTRQFVQLENALVRDRRLDLDEHGMLHYLLSLPDNWEVNQAQCAKFWGIGRDKCRRIFRSLRRTGWAQLERLQSDSGEFIGARWIIGDEPGAEVADDVLASEEAADGDVVASAAEGSDADVTAADGKVDHATENPAHGSPVARVTRRTENPSDPRRKTPEEDRDSTNTSEDAARDDDSDGEPPPAFAEVLKLWPGDNVTSAWASEKLFATFDPKQKRDARDGVKPYLADCRTKGQTRLCDLKTYLAERRWEKFTGSGIRTAASFYTARRGTPQATRWRDYFERTEPRKLAMFDQLMMSSGAYTVASEWPPAIPKDVSAA